MDTVHPDDRASAVAEWESVKAQSEAQGGRAVPHTFTCRFRRKDGSYIWIETASCITPTKWYGVRRCVQTAMLTVASGLTVAPGPQALFC